jgi:hypothetical protein
MTIDIHSAAEDCKELLKSINQSNLTENAPEALRLLDLHIELLGEGLFPFTEEMHNNALWAIYTLATGHDEGEGEAPL